MADKRIIANLIDVFGDKGKISANKLTFITFLYDWAFTLKYGRQALPIEWVTDGNTPSTDHLAKLTLSTDFRCFTKERLGTKVLTDVSNLSNHMEPLQGDELSVLNIIKEEYLNASYDELLVAVNITHPIFTMTEEASALINMVEVALSTKEKLRDSMFLLVGEMPFGDALRSVCDTTEWTTDIAFMQDYLIGLYDGYKLKQKLIN